MRIDFCFEHGPYDNFSHSQFMTLAAFIDLGHHIGAAIVMDSVTLYVKIRITQVVGTNWCSAAH
jgi:hypothetical protein